MRRATRLRAFAVAVVLLSALHRRCVALDDFDSAFLLCSSRERAAHAANGDGCNWDRISLRAAKCFTEAQWQTSPQSSSATPQLRFATARGSATSAVIDLTSALARTGLGPQESLPMNWTAVEIARAEAFFFADAKNPQYNAYLLTASQIGDLVAFNVPQDLTRLLPHAPALAWSSYLPFYRERAAVYNGRVVGLPTHGLLVHLYYRRDLFAAAGLAPPRTWDEAIAVARRFNGTDLDGDGAANDYGMCMWQRPGCPGGHMPLTAILSSMVQLRGEQSGMWFQPTSMKSVVKTAAWLRALQTLSRLAAYSAPVPSRADVDCTYQPMFSQGRCAMAFGAPIQFKYGSLEASALSAAVASVGATVAPSRVRGRIGVAELPGSPVALDWESDSMQPCDKARCPFAVPLRTSELLSAAAAASEPPRLANGTGTLGPPNNVTGSSSSSSDAAAGADAGSGTTWVNVAPYTSWVGNVAYINARKSPQEQLATFVLFAQALSPENSWSLIASPVNFGPTRTQHLDPANRGRWLAYGYHPADLDAFLGATAASLAFKNIASDLRSVAANNVTIVLLRAVAQVAAGLPPPAVANATRVAYEAAFGTANMGAIGASYRASIYYGGPDDAASDPDGQTAAPASSSSSGDSAAVLVPALVASLGGLVLLVGLGIAAWRLRHHWNHGLVRRIRRIVPPGVGPDTTLTVTDIMDSTLLWESLPADVMDVALHLHHDCLRRLATVCGGYESMTEGDSFIFAFHSAQAALLFCLTAQEELPHLDWPEQLLQHPSCRPLWAVETAHVPPQRLRPSKQQLQHQRRRATEDASRTAGFALLPLAVQTPVMPGSRGTSLSGALSLTRRLMQVLSPRQTGSGAVPPSPVGGRRSFSGAPRRPLGLDSNPQPKLAEAKGSPPERQLQQQGHHQPSEQQQQQQQQQTSPGPAHSRSPLTTCAAPESGLADWRTGGQAGGAGGGRRGLATPSGPGGQLSAASGASGAGVTSELAAEGTAGDAECNGGQYVVLPSLPSCAMGGSENCTAELEGRGAALQRAGSGLHTQSAAGQPDASGAVLRPTGGFAATDQRSSPYLASCFGQQACADGDRAPSSGGSADCRHNVRAQSALLVPTTLSSGVAAANLGASFTEAASAREDWAFPGGEKPPGPRSSGQQAVGFVREVSAAPGSGSSGNASAAPKRGCSSSTGYVAGRSRLGCEAVRADSFKGAIQHASALAQPATALQLPQPQAAAADAVSMAAAAAGAVSMSETEPKLTNPCPQRSALHSPLLIMQENARVTTPATSLRGVSARPLQVARPAHIDASAALFQQQPEAAGGAAVSPDVRRALGAPGVSQTTVIAPLSARSPVSACAHAAASASPNSRSRLSLSQQQLQLSLSQQQLQLAQDTQPSGAGYTAAARVGETHRWRPHSVMAQTEPVAVVGNASSVKDLLHTSFNFAAEVREATPAAARSTPAAHRKERHDSVTAALSLPQRFVLMEAAATAGTGGAPTPGQPQEAQLHAHLQHTWSVSGRRAPFGNEFEADSGFGSLPASTRNTNNGMAAQQQQQQQQQQPLSRMSSALAARLRKGLLQVRAQHKPRSVTGSAACAGSATAATGGGGGFGPTSSVAAPSGQQPRPTAVVRSALGAFASSCGSARGPPTPGGGSITGGGLEEHLRALHVARGSQNGPAAATAGHALQAADNTRAAAAACSPAALLATASTTDLECLTTKEEANTATEEDETDAMPDAPSTGETDMQQFEEDGEAVAGGGTVGLSTIMSANGSKSSGRGAAADRGVSVLLLRGLRVRMGCASGVQSHAEVGYNTRMARTIYSGRPLAAAKAIGGAGAGGIVLVSQCTHRLILKQRADGGKQQAAGYVELSLSNRVRAVGGDAAAAGSQRAMFWYGGCGILDPQLPAMELYQAATPAQALRWSALPLPASSPKVQPLSYCVQSAPVGQLAVAVVAVSGAGCIGTLETPGTATDPFDDLGGTSPVWRAVAEQLWGEAARLCLAHGGYLATRRSALMAMAPEVMADSVAARPMANKAMDKADGGGGGGASEKATAGRPRRSLELGRIGAAFKPNGGSRALRERSGRAGQVLLTAVFQTPAAAVLWCAELLAAGLCARWPEQLLQSELGEAMWVGPGAVLTTTSQPADGADAQRSQPVTSLRSREQAAAVPHASHSDANTAAQLFGGNSSDACGGNVSGSSGPGLMLGTSSKPPSDSQWQFRTSASRCQPRPLSQWQQLQQQHQQLFDRLPAQPLDELAPLRASVGGHSVGSRPAAVQSAALDVDTGPQGVVVLRHPEAATTAAASMPPSLEAAEAEEAPSLRLRDSQPANTAAGFCTIPSNAVAAPANGGAGSAPAAAAAADRRHSADNAPVDAAAGSELALRPHPCRDSGSGPDSEQRRSPRQLPAAVLGHHLVCRGPRLRAGVEFGSAAVEINPITGAARYEGAAMSRAAALALSAPVTRVHVGEPVAAAVGRAAAAAAAAAAAGGQPSTTAVLGDSGGGTGKGTLPPAVLLPFMRSALLVTRAVDGGEVVIAPHQ